MHTSLHLFLESQAAHCRKSPVNVKALALVCCDSLLIGRSNTGNYKGVVDIHPATDWVNNFEHDTSPQTKILRKQAGTGRSLKD